MKYHKNITYLITDLLQKFMGLLRPIPIYEPAFRNSMYPH
jgi:hypothetical protein